MNYNKPNQQYLRRMTVSSAKRYLDQGHFAPGSMGPKVKAGIAFIVHCGKQALITHPFKVLEALQGKTGTEITNV